MPRVFFGCCLAGQLKTDLLQSGSYNPLGRHVDYTPKSACLRFEGLGSWA